ncbi:hypothetical protein RCS94_03660 [Orbaceae bacterium ac157xtp]
MKQIKFNNDMVMEIVTGRKNQTRRMIKEWNFITKNEFRSHIWDVQGNFDKDLKCKDINGLPISFIKGTPFSAQIQYKNLIKGCRYGKVGDLIQLLNEDNVNFGQAEIIYINVTRLNDMQDNDFLAEGYPMSRQKDGGCMDPFLWFRTYWDSIYQNWENNPYVWVIHFKLVNFG